VQISVSLILLGTMAVTGATPVPAVPPHEVKLIHHGDHYSFEPSTLTVHSGDRVKFTLVSGGRTTSPSTPTRFPMRGSRRFPPACPIEWLR
jgi:plastocyanin